MKFKVGNRVIRTRPGYGGVDLLVGDTGTVIGLKKDGAPLVRCDRTGEVFGWFPDRCQLITTNTGDNMNLVQNFLNFFKAEPQLTYTKLGIIDDSGVITEAGIKVLLTHLLTEGGTNNDFYTKVAKPMLEKQEEK